MKIEKGHLIIYRVFDIAEEIPLHKAEEQLKLVSKERLKFKKTNRSIVINNPPLSLDLGNIDLTIPDIEGTFKAEVSSKIWDYGSASISFSIDISGQGLTELTGFHAKIKKNTEYFDKIALEKVSEISKTISPILKSVKIWETFEDYNLFYIEKFSSLNNLKELASSEQVAKLLLGDDSTQELSEALIKSTLDGATQYGKNDISIIDWDSGLVVEPTGDPEVRDIQEFALTHLLEIRFYDDFLTRETAVIYDAMNEKRNIFKDTFFNISKKASARYIEFTEFLERFENSIKVVGDPYLATVLRTSYRKFKINDWQINVEKKMSRLAQTSELLQGEVNHQRTMVLEIMIVLLFLYEVISSIWVKVI